MESAVLPANTDKLPVQIFRDPETARLNGILSGKVRRERAIAKRLAKTQPAAQAAIPVVQPVPPTFEEIQLAATRARIRAEYSALTNETDPDARFKLGCLLKKLWEIYQLLAGMPGPGTRKPIAERPKRASQSSEPIED